MRVAASTRIAAPPERIWALAADPSRALGFMSGVTRWEVVGKRRDGLGARYRMLFRIGSAEIGGLIELVEWNEPFDLAWTSVTGVDQRGRLRLRAAGAGATRVEFRLAYGVAGSGLAGWIAELISRRTVAAHLRRTLRQLGRQVESEAARERAAARRGPVTRPAS